MKHSSQKLERSQIKITFTITPAEYDPFLKKAAVRISERAAVKGFRPGHAPYDIIKKEVGEMRIMEEALPQIVEKFFVEVAQAEKLETVGTPKIDLEKIAPGNDLVFNATVAVLPEVKMPDLSTIKVERKESKPDEKQIEETIDSLRGMQAKEVIKDGPSSGTDKMVLDMFMTLDKVPVEGGQSHDYQVYLEEKHYIPGFNEQVIGLKKGDEKTFTLNFPAEHYQKNLAGKSVDFKVTVKEVYTRELPPADDELAKKVGQKDLASLKELIKKNIGEEQKRRAEQAAEAEIMEKLITGSEFEPLPEILVEEEKRKIFHELTHRLEDSGISVKKYLEDLKKTEKEIFDDFHAEAEKRVKAALISRKLAIDEKLSVSPEELNAEIERMKKVYQNEKESLERLENPAVRNMIAVTLQNRKVVEWLKAKIIDKKEDAAKK